MSWKIRGLATAGVYVDDYAKAVAFYQTELGFEKKTDMSETSCWGRIGDLGLFIVKGDGTRSEISRSGCKATLVLNFEHGFTSFFDRMKEQGAALDEQPIPLDGMKASFFRFRDPAGNVLEAAG